MKRIWLIIIGLCLIVLGIGFLLYDSYVRNQHLMRANDCKQAIIDCLQANNRTLIKISDGEMGEHLHHDDQLDFSFCWLCWYVGTENHTVYYSDSYYTMFFVSNTATSLVFDIWSYTS